MECEYKWHSDAQHVVVNGERSSTIALQQIRYRLRAVKSEWIPAMGNN